MSNVSIVMVSYHTGPALWLAIEATLAQPECHELLLVNNGNMPGVLARLAALANKDARFKLLTGHGNIGFAKACNLGARSATGDYILLLNPDSMLPDSGLAKALEIIRRYPEDTLAGCFLVNPDGSEQRGCRRSILTPKYAVADSLSLGFLIPPSSQLNPHKQPMPSQAHEVPAISGAFMMTSRAFYTRLGGLDEGYFLHMEDMDFCYRVHQAGGKVICMPEVVVIHFRSTSEVPSAIVERHKARGFIRYLNLHFAQAHSSAFMFCMSIGIWLRYLLKFIIGIIDKAFVPPLAGKHEVARLVLLYRLVYFGTRKNSLAGKTVLVTGASGQTGACIVGKALGLGANVIAVYNRTRIPFLHPNLTWVQQDLTQSKLTLKADILLHAAGLWLLPDVLPSAFDAGIRRVIAFGSTSVFTKQKSNNAYEQGIAEKLQSAENKITEIAVAKGGDVTILRTTMIYGVGLDSNISRLADIVRRLGILPVHGAASGKRQPIQALDLADTALSISNNPITYGKSYNLGGSQVLTYLEMLTELFTYMGRRVRIIHPPALPQLLNWLGKIYQVGHINGEMALRMNQDLVFDMSEAVHDFGFHAKAYLEGDVVI